MPRVIKFRAWDASEKEMVCWPSLYNDPDDWFISLLEGNEPDDVLMQFTGLADKNGKEIYEGDVLSMDSWEPKNVQVRFIEGAFCLANGKGEYIGDIHYINHADRPQSTVIGNIYQNPELLTK